MVTSVVAAQGCRVRRVAHRSRKTERIPSAKRLFRIGFVMADVPAKLPPPGGAGDIPKAVHYRESDDPARSCGSCAYFDSGVCELFNANVAPSYVCDKWEAVTSDHAPHSVEAYNETLRKAYKRADELEAPFAAVLQPILAEAGTRAATAFQRRATDHLTAAIEMAKGAALTAALTPTSTMVALMPRPKQAEAIADDGEPAAELHCTLVYIGEYDGDLAVIAAPLAQVAASHAPLSGVVSGYGQFGEPANVGILLPDVPGLVELRVAVTEALTAAGIDYARSHGFLQHITVASPAGKVTLDGAETDDGRASTQSARGSEAGRGLSDLRQEPIREAQRASEGGRDTDLRPSDHMDARDGRDIGNGDSHSPSLRERPMPEHQAHATIVGIGTRSRDESIPGEVFGSRDAVREEGREGMGEVQGLRAGRYAEVPSEAARRGYPASAYGLPLNFDEIFVVRANAEVIAIPLTGATPLTAAANPQWTSPAGDEMLDVAALIASITAKTDPIRLAFIQSVMTPALEAAGISFDATNPLVASILESSTNQIAGIVDTTQANIMKIIRASYEQGLSIPDTAKAIEAGMEQTSVTRATMIARTTMTAATNGGALAATKIVQQATGVTHQKRWLTAPGAAYPRHEDYEGLDGQTVGLDDKFDVGGNPFSFPGDPDGDAGDSVNCRCAMSFTDDPADNANGIDS